MTWDIKKLNQHKKAAELINKIKDEAFALIKNTPGISEFEVQKFIMDGFEKYDLKTDSDKAIVAFRENTGFVHNYPDEVSKRIAPESLIMIDLWARLDEEDAPFADITWMAYYGERVDKEIFQVYLLVIKARNAALKFIRRNLKKGKLPIGKEIDDIVRGVIKTAGYGEKFTHTTGHSLGFDSPHGKEFGLNWKNEHPLIKNLPYTIEPGVYLEGNFGIRSEIDFYIDNDLQLIITTKVQDELIII